MKRCALVLALGFAALGCELPVVVGRECTLDGCADGLTRMCQGPACMRAQRCSGRQRVTRAGLDMYLMIDASSSQFFSWNDMKQGLSMFLSDPASSGVGVGLQFFGDSCDPESYAKPAAPIMLLPQGASTLLSVFPLAATQDTPTRPALAGAISYARRWQVAHPARNTIVSLVTDGFPEECESTEENVSAVASEGLSGSPSIRTFVVGVDSIGSIFRFVNGVAVFGGAPALTVPAQSPDALATAFASVRDTAASCRYALPVPLSLAADGSSRLLQVAEDGRSSDEPVVADEQACDPARGGVYLDPDIPQQLHACPATCARLAAASELELLTSCPP